MTKEAVIQGIVTRDGQPVGGAYVRLLDAHRRVHRRGADVGDRAVPVLRRARVRGRCAPSRPAPAGRPAVVAEQGAVAEVEVALPA